MATIERQAFRDRWAVAERAAKPARVQIKEQLADRIESGRLSPGQRLPAERVAFAADGSAVEFARDRRRGDRAAS